MAEDVKFRLTPRQRLIMPVLMCGSFFEGFDWMVINLALPFISRDMGIGIEFTGLALSIVAIGTLVAFFVVRLGDRIGRRPVFLWSVSLYAIMSLLTAFSPNIYFFIACQFLARVFLVAEWATGMIVIAEEFPVEMRGRGLTLFQGVAAIGAIFPSLLMPLMSKTPLSWRLLFIVGVLPLFVVLLLRKNLSETERFQRIKESHKPASDFFAVFKPAYRKYMLTVSALWFMAYLCYAASMNFFSYRVVNELGWKEGRVGMTTAVAYLLGLSGYFVAGKLLDSIGRKKTAVLFFVGGSIGTICAFQATGYIWVLVSLIIGTFFVGVFTVLCASFTNELFPTAIRANATAWGNNIIGRLAQILAPSAVGFLAVSMHGTGNAVSLMAAGPIVAAVLVILLLPETRNQEMQDFVETAEDSPGS